MTNSPTFFLLLLGFFFFFFLVSTKFPNYLFIILQYIKKLHERLKDIFFPFHEIEGSERTNKRSREKGRFDPFWDYVFLIKKYYVDFRVERFFTVFNFFLTFFLLDIIPLFLLILQFIFFLSPCLLEKWWKKHQLIPSSTDLSDPDFYFC